MNLSELCKARAETGKPVRAGLIGAGKFGSMFLAQVPSIDGLEVAAIADLDPNRARAACAEVGWDVARIETVAFDDDGRALAARDDVEVVIEAWALYRDPDRIQTFASALERGMNINAMLAELTRPEVGADGAPLRDAGEFTVGAELEDVTVIVRR